MKRILGITLGVIILATDSSLFAEPVIFLCDVTLATISSAARRTITTTLDDPARITSIEEWGFGDTRFYRVFVCDHQCMEIRLGMDGRILKTLQVYQKNFDDFAVTAAAESLPLEKIPVAVLQTVDDSNPKAEVDHLTSVVCGQETIYDVTLSAPASCNRLRITERGQLVEKVLMGVIPDGIISTKVNAAIASEKKPAAPESEVSAVKPGE